MRHVPYLNDQMVERTCLRISIQVHVRMCCSVCCRVLHCVAVFVAVCCCVLQMCNVPTYTVAYLRMDSLYIPFFQHYNALQHTTALTATHCNTLQHTNRCTVYPFVYTIDTYIYVAWCCRVLQGVMCCGASQYAAGC